MRFSWRWDQLADDATLKPDLILICRKPDAGILELVRVGSHSEIGL
jgi:mRNA interferase YafQ